MATYDRNPAYDGPMGVLADYDFCETEEKEEKQICPICGGKLHYFNDDWFQDYDGQWRLNGVGKYLCGNGDCLNFGF